MSTPVRVAAFAMALVIAFLGARAVGSLVGPVAGETVPAGHEPTGHEQAEGHGAGDHGAENPDEHGDHEQAAAVQDPGGLSDTDAGHTLRVVSEPRPGSAQPLRFVVEGPTGVAVTAYDEVHGRRLHLVTIRRDGTGYEHLHPTLAADGTWTAQPTLAPGSTRLIADFTPTGGPELVLGTDVHVGGDYDPAPPPPVTASARVDGYRVTLEGDLVAGESSPLTATITRRGAPVTDLQPYLGARGHLVALRESDLAYLHVHPDESGGAGPEIGFRAEVPGPGRYRLFLDFRHAGAVRTVGFTLETRDGHGHDH